MYILYSVFYLTIFAYVRYNIKLEQLVIDKELALDKTLSIFGENVIASNSDLKGIITYASPALCEISGFTKEELVGKQHNKLRHPDMPSKLFKGLWETIQTGEIWEGEVKNITKEGGHYWVRAKIIPNRNTNGEVIGYQSVRHDITSQKAKEEFMANMSHELRTPLNSIIGFSGILNKKQIDAQHRNLSKQINLSANSLLSLINDILDLAKIQDSKFTIEAFEFNAYEEMVEFTEQFEGLTAKKTLIFHNKLDATLKGVFLGDWLRINQIALNLISNAVKFTPKDGEITFSGDYKGGVLSISVADNGIGMSQEVQDKIFKPFEQADGTTTRQYGGTGLGLSITQSLVEMMNGHIELESEESKGTTLTIRIPLEKLRDADTLVQEISPQEEIDLSPLNTDVLVAEDNKTNQMLIKMC